MAFVSIRNIFHITLSRSLRIPIYRIAPSLALGISFTGTPALQMIVHSRFPDRRFTLEQD